MADVLIDDKHLEDIADAIRGKNGSDDLYKPREMAAAIEAIEGKDLDCNGMHVPEEALVISGNCSYWDYCGKWDWFVELYGDKLKTEKIDFAHYMFGSSNIETLPFEINFADGGGTCNNMFNGTKYLSYIPSIDFKQTTNLHKDTKSLFSGSGVKEIGTIKNLYPSDLSEFFYGCKNLRYLPEFENLNLSRIQSYSYASCASMFKDCHSLRAIPEEFLNQLGCSQKTNGYYTVFYNGFTGCYALEEIRGLNPVTATVTGNMFLNTFHCARAKDVTFSLQDDGTPYIAKWKNQTIDICYTGYQQKTSVFTGYNATQYNSGITEDKAVYDDETYAALKNEPDWFAYGHEYSRFNKESAKRFIASLPDTSAYLASAGGTNTIKFKGEAGSKTDGGAIQDLDEETIAIAASRGWTISFA